jgi:hypothetical protein
MFNRRWPREPGGLNENEHCYEQNERADPRSPASYYCRDDEWFSRLNADYPNPSAKKLATTIHAVASGHAESAPFSRSKFAAKATMPCANLYEAMPDTLQPAGRVYLNFVRFGFCQAGLMLRLDCRDGSFLNGPRRPA